MPNTLKQMMEMKKKADALQRELAAIQVERTNASRTLSVRVNGTQRVESVRLDASWLSPEKKEALESSLAQVINEALAETQKRTAAQAAALMRELKGLDIPGL